MRAVLGLEDGTCYEGLAIGALGKTGGEVVFNTSMTGYQEILTDPSYAGQIVTMTAAEIGNYGVTPEDTESGAPKVAGFIVRDASPIASNWRASGTLQEYLERYGIVAIAGIDTRALTRKLRSGGVMRGAIATGEATREEVVELARDVPMMEGSDLVKAVTCAEPYEWDPEAGGAFRVAAYDFGVKLNLLRRLRTHGCDVCVYPASTPANQVLASKPDGVFLSNGPGDPAALDYAIDNVREVVDANVPVFGVCLGHQLLALALGGRTYKLKFGHRGGNHPVSDVKTGKVEITSQNHGFAVDPASLPPTLEVTHVNLYDRTVEGLRDKSRPAFSVQYHPEASPGPHDSDYLFSAFLEEMLRRR